MHPAPPLMPPAPTRRSSHQLTFAVLAVGVIAFGLLQSLVTPVLVTFAEALHTTQADVTWMLTAYLLAAAVCTPIVGRLGDLVGKKRMFVITLAALALGCLLAALAGSLGVMIVARAIQGIGGGVLPLAFGIIRDEFPGAKVPGAIGSISALIAVGGGAGTVLAGPIVGAFDYHWLFWFPLIVLVAAGGAAFALVPESRTRAAGSVNWPTAALLSVWLVCLLLAVSEAPTWGWTSPAVLLLLAAAVVVLVAWGWAESRAAHPLIDMGMMRIRGVWTTNLSALLFGVAMYAGFAFIPEFLQMPTATGYGLGASITESGVMLLPQAAATFLVGLVAGRLAQRFGSKNLLVAGSVISAAGYLVLALAHDARWEIYAIGVLMGLGFGLAFAAMSNLVVAAVPPSQTGVASGMNANIRTIGGAIGAAVVASVVTAHVLPIGLPTESGYVNGFLLLTGALLLGAVAALFVPSIRRDVRTHSEPDVELRHPEAALVAGGTVVGDEPE
jgi:EmrB/QacA subfamily drug resistance transporter